LVAGRGAFQPALLASLAASGGAATENYRGITLIGGAKPTDAKVAFLDGTTVLMGDGASVKAAVDRWLGGRSSGSLSARATEVSSTSQAWAVAAGLNELQGQTGTYAAPEAQMIQNVLAKIRQVSGGMNFGDTITLQGQMLTASAQDAQALADVFQFLMSMAAPKSPLPALPQVSTVETSVNFTLTLTEQQAEQLFKPAVAPRAAVRK
jgi:hypothetical protein